MIIVPEKEIQEKKEKKIRVGITHGDINGISYEVIIKTLHDNRIMELFTPIVYGSSKIASYHRKNLNINDFSFNLIKKVELANPKRPNIINCYDNEVKINIGKSTDIAGKLSYLALKAAVQDLNEGEIDVIVTAPINKKNINSTEFSFAGHTEFFAKSFNSKDYLMLMVTETLRIGVVTGHIPLKDVSSAISSELILNKIEILNNSLINDFGIRKPKIAILGLNPHSGDYGLIGSEEHDIIIPSIEKAQENGYMVYGPFSADGFFGSSNYIGFDAILAMYHDQGLIPFKTIANSQGVNFTAGLPIVRTSPAHGTAYEIAGKNIASPDSFRQAIYLALDIYRTRKMNDELNKNPLKSSFENEDQILIKE
jgi:4-hydroxythreonine-4-phosphate dehydrogenase